MKNQVLLPSATIKQAMQVVDQATVKLCVVVDDGGKIRRTLTDGDIRRALLAGCKFDTPIAELPHVKPVTFRKSAEASQMLQSMRAHSIQAVVIVDEDDRPIELVARDKIEQGILLSPPHMSAGEMSFIQKAMDENWVAPAGPNLVTFEENLAAFSQRKHALALASGTAGLHLALRVLDIGPGHRVYVSDLTFIASVQPILYQGATPVLIDSEPDSWNMSPAALRRCLEKDAAAGQLPKAVIVAHIYGQSADMKAICAACDAFGVPIVEDAAESLGASYGNRPSGSHGLLSVFSFNGNKIITTSGGGALVSDRGDLIARARNLSQQGRDTAEHYQHSEIAYNYRMSNILAGIGVAQLAVLPDRVARRREIFQRYRDGLGAIKGIRFQADVPDSQGNRWLTVVSFDPNHISRHPYQFMRGLRNFGIETRPAWKPMHLQPLLHACEFVPHDGAMPVSDGLFLQSLCLPSGSSLSNDDQDRIIAAILHLVQED